MKKFYEYLALFLSILGLYNLSKLTIIWMDTGEVNIGLVWVSGIVVILTYIINKVLEKQNKK
jgi:hypothetical protein